MAATHFDDARYRACPFNTFQPCLGADCMAWVWDGPPDEHRETDNLAETPEGLRPVGDPPAPDGDGWEKDGPAYAKGYHRSSQDKLPKASAQRWIRKRPQTTGRCGRIPGDSIPW